MPQHEINNGDLPKQTGIHSHSRRRWPWLMAAVVLAIGFYAWFAKDFETTGRSDTQGSKASTFAATVSAVPARKGDIGVYLTGLGTVTPLNTVTLKSRVDGELMRVHFSEGEVIAKSKLLAEIDPRPFQALLAQAEGQLIRDREQLRNAKIDLQRYQILSEQDSIPRQQYDTQKSLVQQLEGAVKADQGQVENARLQLIYSRITAPISGRVGLRQVDPGNIIHATDATGLVVITQLQPITVIFPISEVGLPQVLRKLKQGASLKVEALDREMEEKLATGELLAIDSQIDPTTGTVKLKALFPNSGNELFPGEFVNARLLVEMIRDAVIVPDGAIQRGPQGIFVFIVNTDQTVTMGRITVGVTENGETSVTAGLSPGDLVVVEGAEKLREGSKVTLAGHNGSVEKKQ